MHKRILLSFLVLAIPLILGAMDHTLEVAQSPANPLAVDHMSTCPPEVHSKILIDIALSKDTHKNKEAELLKITNAIRNLSHVNRQCNILVNDEKNTKNCISALVQSFGIPPEEAAGYLATRGAFKWLERQMTTEEQLRITKKIKILKSLKSLPDFQNPTPLPRISNAINICDGNENREVTACIQKAYLAMQSALENELFIAINSSNIPTVATLLQAGINPNNRRIHTDNEPPLHFSFEDPYIMPLLLAKGANPYITNTFCAPRILGTNWRQETILHAAAHSTHPMSIHIAEQFIPIDMPYGIDNQTPLMIAVQTGSEIAVRTLLDLGANPSSPSLSNPNLTPLGMARTFEMRTMISQQIAKNEILGSQEIPSECITQ